MVSYYSIRRSNQLAGSGFRAAESVKSDTAQLVAAIQGIIYKAAVWSQQDKAQRNSKDHAGYVDIKPEKASIQEFLNSATALAYYIHADKKSMQAKERTEEWRTFFLKVVELVSAENPWSAGAIAVDLEKQLAGLSDADISEMSKSLENLPDAINKLHDFNQQDIVVQTITSVVEERAPSDPKEFERFVKFLRDQGVKDPDVDLFWATFRNDTTLLQNALGAGANPRVTDRQVVSRYKDMWTQFDSGK